MYKVFRGPTGVHRKGRGFSTIINYQIMIYYFWWNNSEVYKVIIYLLLSLPATTLKSCSHIIAIIICIIIILYFLFPEIWTRWLILVESLHSCQQSSSDWALKASEPGKDRTLRRFWFVYSSKISTCSLLDLQTLYNKKDSDKANTCGVMCFIFWLGMHDMDCLYWSNNL